MSTAAQTTGGIRWAREYETIYILRPNVAPDEAEKVSSRVAEVIDRLGAKLTKVDNWGKRRLAYTIAKNTRGIFVYVRYVGFGDVVAEIERNLRMLDSVIRYQTVVMRQQVDIDKVEIDPEEVKFIPIEVGPEEEEEEPGLEERLGMRAMPEPSDEAELGDIADADLAAEEDTTAEERDEE